MPLFTASIITIPMDFSFTVANPTDCEALRVFSKRLFVDTYAAQNTPENMDIYCRAAFSAEHFNRDYHRPEVRYLTARVDEALAAYAKLVLGSTPAGQTTPGVEMARFYVDVPFQGRGLAREFMAECQQWVRAQGYPYLWLGVWPQNPRAVRFYQKEGFQKIGTATFLLGTDPQTDDIMCKVF
jgi:diamine N-acetyltransferase